MAIGKISLVETQTVTSAVATVEFTSKITTDDVYMLTFSNVVPATDTQVLFWRFKNSSGDVTSSNYDYAMKVFRSSSAFSNFNNANQSAFRDFTVGTGTQESENGILYLYNFNNSSEFSFYTHNTVVVDDQQESSGMVGSGFLTVSESHTGITFFFGSGNIASGTFTLYKVV